VLKDVTTYNLYVYRFCYVVLKHVHSKKLILDHSLNFVIDRLFVKLFRTNNTDTVRQCQQFLYFDLPSVTVVNRAAKFESEFIANCNSMLLL